MGRGSKLSDDEEAGVEIQFGDGAPEENRQEGGPADEER